MVHLSDDRNPEPAPGRPMYTVCGLEVSPIESDACPRSNIETARDPARATCPECRRGPAGYTWYRVVGIDPPDIHGEATRSHRTAWESYHAAVDHPRSSWTSITIQATTRRAAAEARPRIPFMGVLWYPLGPWLQGRLLGRIGRGRWRLLSNR